MMSRFQPHGPLGLGGAPIGNLFDRVSAPVAQETIEAAWAAGIRHFDTAPHYGAGLSERRLGDGLRAYPRDAYTLSTKVGRLLEPAAAVPEIDRGFAGGLSFRRKLDYSAAGARRSLEDSLQRLGLPSVDIVYIHDVAEDRLGPDWKKHFADAMTGAAKTLNEMRRAGAIKAWGLGVNLVEPCLAALEAADPDIFLVAGRYTLLDQSALDRLLPACVRRGVGVVIGGPYNSGLLAGGTTYNYEKAPPALVARTEAIKGICARHDVNLKAVALQFCAAHPAVVTVLAGARTPAEARENAAIMQVPVPPAVWTELKTAGLLPEAAPVARD
jgi:D-threo-aldose 1-dehydrogenase